MKSLRIVIVVVVTMILILTISSAQINYEIFVSIVCRFIYLVANR
jgi:hypothetical protein